MKICDSCDIVYAENQCPLCVAIAEIEDLQQQLTSVDSEIKFLTLELKRQNAAQG